MVEAFLLTIHSRTNWIEMFNCGQIVSGSRKKYVCACGGLNMEVASCISRWVPDSDLVFYLRLDLRYCRRLRVLDQGCSWIWRLSALIWFRCCWCACDWCLVGCDAVVWTAVRRWRWSNCDILVIISCSFPLSHAESESQCGVLQCRPVMYQYLLSTGLGD